jgi:hypothetical protein
MSSKLEMVQETPAKREGDDLRSGIRDPKRPASRYLPGTSFGLASWLGRVGCRSATATLALTKTPDSCLQCDGASHDLSESWGAKFASIRRTVGQPVIEGQPLQA